PSGRMIWKVGPPATSVGGFGVAKIGSVASVPQSEAATSRPILPQPKGITKIFAIISVVSGEYPGSPGEPGLIIESPEITSSSASTAPQEFFEGSVGTGGENGVTV